MARRNRISAGSLDTVVCVINGAHSILYSLDAEADRVFLRDVLGFRHVDAGHGWLIFQLPPAEAAVHPTEGEPGAELYLMCDDLPATLSDLAARGVVTGDRTEARWGAVVSVSLPSGLRIGLYEPRHPVAHDLG